MSFTPSFHLPKHSPPDLGRTKVGRTNPDGMGAGHDELNGIFAGLDSPQTKDRDGRIRLAHLKDTTHGDRLDGNARIPAYPGR